MPNAQSPFQKLNFGYSGQKKKKQKQKQKQKKTRKSRYQNFLALSHFAGSLYFARNIWSGMVEEK